LTVQDKSGSFIFGSQHLYYNVKEQQREGRNIFRSLSGKSVKKLTSSKTNIQMTKSRINRICGIILAEV